MDLPTRDGDGYLTDINDWTPEVGHEMARMDGVEMTDQKWEHILAAREMYEDRQTVPPIRKFASAIGVSTEELYGVWKGGPMKLNTKYGGQPKPAGCV